MAVAAWLTVAAYAALADLRLADAALIAEAALLAFALRSRRDRWRPWWSFALATLAAVHLVLALRARFPALGDDARGLGKAVAALAPLLTPALLRAGLGVALQAVWPLFALAAAVGVPAALIARHAPAWQWRLPLLAALAVALGAALRDQDARSPEVAQLDLAVELAPAGWDGLLREAAPPRLAKAPPGARSAALVMLESVGKENLAEHERRHAGCLFPKWRAEGLAFDTVIPTGSVSHIAQPGVLLSHFAARPPGNTVSITAPPQPTLPLAAFFAGRGYRTALVSSQDERWMGLSELTLAAPWTRAVTSLDHPVAEQYADPCGVVKALDSATVAVALEELRRPGPSFVYVNLQNTHFAYVVEGGALPKKSAVDCSVLFSPPPAEVAPLLARYQEALLEAEARLAKLRAAAPGAVFLITGDHGESFEQGPGFGHGKNTRASQDASFAFFVGPGVPRRSSAAPLSALDLAPTLLDLVDPAALRALDPGVFEGQSALASAEARPIVTTAQGFFAEYAALALGRKTRYRPRLEQGCTTLDDQPAEASDPGCAASRRALVAWMGCQEHFYREAGFAARHWNPCVRVAARAAR